MRRFAPMKHSKRRSMLIDLPVKSKTISLSRGISGAGAVLRGRDASKTNGELTAISTIRWICMEERGPLSLTTGFTTCCARGSRHAPLFREDLLSKFDHHPEQVSR